MKFTKMQGAGNDFVVINAIRQTLPEPFPEFAKRIADRHFGVGCDQVLVIEESRTADFRMTIFNRDGGQVEMCGNGIRCLARYVRERGLSDNKRIAVETLAGTIHPEIVDDGVRVDMGRPALRSEDWIFHGEKVIDREIRVGEELYKITLVSMGNPHCVVFVDDLNAPDLTSVGPEFENHEAFPNRMNTEFVKVLNGKEIRARVWERGSGETLACGTGASAAVVASALNGMTERDVEVHLPGGVLKVEWSRDGRVYMTGPAEFVFEGVI